VSMISCGDILSVSFGKMIAETPVEKRFFRELRRRGHAVSVGTNHRSMIPRRDL
jgi:predicted nicotinamide N-methyase